MVEYREKGYVNGKMDVNIKDHGLIIKSMDMVYILGLMVEDMKVITKMIKSMEQEHIHGQMGGNM
jgi:hypothetical protein